MDDSKVLLVDESEIDVNKEYVSEYKDKAIYSESSDMFEDISHEIKIVINHIPDNLSTLEKIRWIYINLGKLFSYDFRVANDTNLLYNKNTDIDKPVNRYQTCIQITDILNDILNNIDGVKSKKIARKLDNLRGRYEHDHVANEVTFTQDGEEMKIMLDLTLDLYFIQSGCKTKHFGYDSSPDVYYDIIPQVDNLEMDKKLGFITDERDYTDHMIEDLSTAIHNANLEKLNPKDAIDTNLLLINKLVKTFQGYHEGKQYLNMLFSKLLHADYREFNLYNYNDDKVNLKTIYKIDLNGAEKWVIYSNKLGLISTDLDKIEDMLGSGWTTNSGTLKEIIRNKNNTESSKRI